MYKIGEITGGVPVLDGTEILIKRPGLHKFRYIINDKETYLENKLHFVASDGITYNYIIMTKNEENKYEYNERFLVESMAIGDIEAAIILAKLYMRNHKYNDAVECYKNAIASGSIIAMRELADYYRKEHPKKAKKYYKMAAISGDVKSMIRVGLIYTQLGKIKKAKIYYEIAVSHGNTCAMCFLGDYYKNVENNKEKAREYYLSAINEGFDFARICLNSL